MGWIDKTIGRRRACCRVGAAVLAAVCALAGQAQRRGAGQPDTSLADLSLEQLGDIEVLSVSRAPERLAEAPSSVYVITNEQIRRAAATNLGEALRLAPNL